MKKYIAYTTLIVIGLAFGISLTYINAGYTNQSANAPVGNSPAPIAVGNLSGDAPFLKPGKIGVGTGSTVADVNQFANNSFVVGGQTTFAQGMGAGKDFEVRGELASTSSLKAFVFGDPTDSDLWQVDGNSNPRSFYVKGYTRAPYVVVGSTSASPTNYNLYVEPSGLSDSGFGFGSSNYCTITADDLKNKGCPINFKYSSTVYTPTYLGRVTTGTGSAVVGHCRMMTEFEGGPINKGNCYP